MKLYEIASQKGTYAGLRLDDESCNKLIDWCTQNNIPNPVPKDKLHTTLLYSRKHLPDYVPQGNLPSAYIGLENGYDIWKSSSENPTNCLVLKINCDDIVTRHKELMDTHQATWDYPSYDPHITMSYDIGGVDASKLDTSSIGELTFTDEYAEELDLDWTSNNLV